MTAAPRRRTTLILAIALAVSLCLNLFAGGAWLAGRWFDRRVEETAASVMRAYPPELRRDVLRRLLQDRAELRSAVGGLREARQRMVAVMRADPLDRAALDAAMAEVRSRTGALSCQSGASTEVAASAADGGGAPVILRRRRERPSR